MEIPSTHMRLTESSMDHQEILYRIETLTAQLQRCEEGEGPDEFTPDLPTIIQGIRDVCVRVFQVPPAEVTSEMDSEMVVLCRMARGDVAGNEILEHLMIDWEN